MVRRAVLVAATPKLSDQLARCGFHVTAAQNIDRAVSRLLEGGAVHVVVLQAGGLTLVDWCRALRLFSTVPILVVLEAPDEQRVVAALEAGADSVVEVPVSRSVLAARLDALCKPSRITPPPVGVRPYVYRFGDLVIDPDAYVVWKDGEHVSLTPTEFRLLLALARRGGDLARHDELLTEVWGPVYAANPEHLRLFIRSVRRKLGDDRGQPRLVLNQRGVGYRLAKEGERIESLAS